MKSYRSLVPAMGKLVSEVPRTEPEDLEALLPEVDAIMRGADSATEQAMRALAEQIGTEGR